MSISSFYEGKNIFITGATGFIGKCLIEKLLRSCHNIGYIYVLIRPKKNLTARERLNKIYENGVFDIVKREKPGLFEKKVLVVEGDTTKLQLGLSEVDKKLITQNVHVIFSSAASIKFDDHIRDSLLINLRGAREIAKIALEIKNLKVFVHLSTAYVNCERNSKVQEILYPPKIDWRVAIELAEKYDPAVLAILTSKVIGGMPNTYTFAKSLAEHCIRDLCEGNIPVTIIRPSIVTCSLADPFSGWIDNIAGPAGIMMGVTKGVLRCVHCKQDVKGDYVPVDIVVKSSIASAWDLALRKRNDFEVYNITSYGNEWIRKTNSEISELALNIMAQAPVLCLGPPSSRLTNCRYYYYIVMFFTQLIPALLIDGLLLMFNKPPVLLFVQKKMYLLLDSLQFFYNKEFSFLNYKMKTLARKVSKEDMHDFNFDFSNCDFAEYAKNYYYGVRKFILKESEENIPYYKKLLRRQIWFRNTFYLIFFGVMFWYLDPINMTVHLAETIRNFLMSRIGIEENSPI